MSLEDYPSIELPLPDGTRLKAVAIDDENFPAIKLYWDRNTDDPQEEICFAEFNPERDSQHRLCIGVYQSHLEDTTYYKPYMAERECE